MPDRRFVLLDRDGTITVEKHYLATPDDVELVPGAAAGLRRLASLGLGLIVVTNQSGIGRGLIEPEQLDHIHRRMREALAAEGVRLDDVYVCPHRPGDGCPCRKPRTGLVELAAASWRFDPAGCFVVGDLPSDAGLARALGATSVLVRTGHGADTEAGGEATWDHAVDDLEAAARLIERLLGAGSAGAP